MKALLRCPQLGPTRLLGLTVHSLKSLVYKNSYKEAAMTRCARVLVLAGLSMLLSVSPSVTFSQTTSGTVNGVETLNNIERPARTNTRAQDRKSTRLNSSHLVIS